ncbi:GNAT family N-acetyltransferase [Leptospira sp. 96542]|nr:GNAT family N-acetyltransferase [Leptospira sp. 96542]
MNVYRSAIRLIAARDYTPEQIRAWAPEDVDTEAWARRMHGIKPFVVEHEGRIVAYADVQADGYIDHFFVSGTHERQGLGNLLMARIHEEAAVLKLTCLHSHVSRTAQPFFMRWGFAIVELQRVERRGVVLDNARMSKALAVD